MMYLSTLIFVSCAVKYTMIKSINTVHTSFLVTNSAQLRCLSYRLHLIDIHIIDMCSLLHG